MVRTERFELSRPFGHRGLSPARLPFRHVRKVVPRARFELAHPEGNSVLSRARQPLRHLGIDGVQRGTRTPKALRPPGSQPSAYTSSATWTRWCPRVESIHRLWRFRPALNPSATRTWRKAGESNSKAVETSSRLATGRSSAAASPSVVGSGGIEPHAREQRVYSPPGTSMGPGRYPDNLRCQRSNPTTTKPPPALGWRGSLAVGVVRPRRASLRAQSSKAIGTGMRC